MIKKILVGFIIFIAFIIFLCFNLIGSKKIPENEILESFESTENDTALQDLSLGNVIALDVITPEEETETKTIAKTEVLKETPKQETKENSKKENISYIKPKEDEKQKEIIEEQNNVKPIETAKEEQKEVAEEKHEEPKENTESTIPVVPVIPESAVTEEKYIRNDTMINRIRETINNNPSKYMIDYGYEIVVDSSIKEHANQFTFTETRVKAYIAYSFGTIRIYAEDYIRNGQLIMTECYIY